MTQISSSTRLTDLVKIFGFILLSFSSSFLFVPLVRDLYLNSPNKVFFFTIISAFDCSLAILLLFVFGKFVEKKSFGSYGFTGCTTGGGVREFLGGVGTAAVMVSTVMLILYLSGCYKVLGASWNDQFVAYLPFWLMAALREEVIFRGYVLQTLQKSWGATGAIVISSMIFGFLHLINFDSQVSLSAQLYSCLCLSIDAGLVFAVAYYVRRRLWFPFGLHVTWNVFEGPVYGTLVSSLALGKPLLHAQLNGNFLLTGGVFGPEASLIEVGVCLLLTAILWKQAKITTGENQSHG